MGLDMFMFIFGVRDNGPVVLPVLAWSQGCSTSFDVTTKQPASLGADAQAEQWSTQSVAEWLSRPDTGADAQTVQAFRDADVDGRALLALTSEDLKELVPKIGLRRRIQSSRDKLLEAISEKKAYDEQSRKVNFHDLSCTLYSTAGTQLSLFHPLVKFQVLPRVVLVVYTAAPRRGRWGGDDDDNNNAAWKLPPGTATQMIDLRTVSVSSISSGGSGGEDNLTMNVTLVGKTMAHSLFSTHDFRNISWNLHGARLLGVDPKDDRWRPDNEEVPATDRGMGVTVWYRGSDAAPQLTEWGKHVQWSPATHLVYPEEFKTIVRTVLLCAKRTASDVNRLPRGVLHMIFARLSGPYSATPLEEFPHPHPETLVPKPEEEEKE